MTDFANENLDHDLLFFIPLKILFSLNFYFSTVHFFLPRIDTKVKLYFLPLQFFILPIFYGTLCKQQKIAMWSFYSNWNFFFSSHFTHIFLLYRDRCKKEFLNFATKRVELPRRTEKYPEKLYEDVENFTTHTICNFINALCNLSIPLVSTKKVLQQVSKKW